MRKLLSAGANRRACQSLSKASESDAYHSSSRRLMLESAAFTLAMSARATSTLAGVGLMGQAAPDQAFCAAAEFIVKSLRTLHTNNQVNAVEYISQAESFEKLRHIS
eukprot:scaffold2544_cov28-Phaeocystis_antarctica.AAC.2